MVHNDSKLLTTLTLKNDEQLIGIVDFINNKQLYFFDFSKEHNVDYILLSVLWQGNAPNLRFSVFCTINYPKLHLPKALLIPLSSIEKTNHPLTKTIKAKNRRVRVRSL